MQWVHEGILPSHLIFLFRHMSQAWMGRISMTILCANCAQDHKKMHLSYPSNPSLLSIIGIIEKHRRVGEHMSGRIGGQLR